MGRYEHHEFLPQLDLRFLQIQWEFGLRLLAALGRLLVGSNSRVSFEQMDEAALACQSDYGPCGVRLQRNKNEASKRSNALILRQAMAMKLSLATE